MGARGNSGVILSQILRGLAEGLGAGEPVDAGGVADALSAPAGWPTPRSCARWRARSSPSPGTRPRAADGARDARPGRGAGGRRPRPRPRRSSARPSCCPCWPRPAWSTPAAPASCSSSTPCSTWPTAARCPSRPTTARPAAVPRRHGRRRRRADEAGDGGRYEVMYFLEAPDEAVDGFKQAWDAIGDSIVVVGGDGLWNCHIHTDDIGAAIEAGHRRRRPAPQDPGHRPAPAGGRRAPATASTGRHRGGRRRRRRGRRRHPALPRRAGGGGRRPVDEPLHRPDPRRHRGDDGRRGRRPAQQQERRPGGRAGGPAGRPAGPGRARPGAWPRAWRRCWPTTRRPTSTPTSRPWSRPPPGWRGARSPGRCGTRPARRPAPSQEGDWLGLDHGTIAVVAPRPGRRRLRPARPARRRPPRGGHPHRGRRRPTPAVTEQITEWLAKHRPEAAVEVHHGGQPLAAYLFSVE